MNEELKEYFRELRMEIQQILQDDTDIPPRNMIEKMIFQLVSISTERNGNFWNIINPIKRKRSTILKGR